MKEKSILSLQAVNHIVSSHDCPIGMFFRCLGNQTSYLYGTPNNHPPTLTTPPPTHTTYPRHSTTHPSTSSTHTTTHSVLYSAAHQLLLQKGGARCRVLGDIHVEVGKTWFMKLVSSSSLKKEKMKREKDRYTQRETE